MTSLEGVEDSHQRTPKIGMSIHVSLISFSIEITQIEHRDNSNNLWASLATSPIGEKPPSNLPPFHFFTHKNHHVLPVPNSPLSYPMPSHPHLTTHTPPIHSPRPLQNQTQPNIPCAVQHGTPTPAAAKTATHALSKTACTTVR